MIKLAMDIFGCIFKSCGFQLLYRNMTKYEELWLLFSFLDIYSFQSINSVLFPLQLCVCLEKLFAM